MGELIGLITVVLALSIPIVAIWTGHKRQMVELQMQQGNTLDSNLRAELDAMRNEIRSLRDTTTQYDISFDTALQRMDQRVGLLEQKSIAADPDTNQPYRIGNR